MAHRLQCMLPLQRILSTASARCGLVALALATVVAMTIATHSASAQAQQAKQNWMADYVRLRVAVKTLQSAGRDPSRAMGPEIEALMKPRIVGGTVAGAADNQFQVALLNAAQPNNSQAQFCGGTLIRPNIVVTAAHCSDFVTAATVQVLTGTRALDGTGQRRDVTQITIHPGWNPSTFDNDVAVWQLSTEATGIYPGHPRHRRWTRRRRLACHGLGNIDRGRRPARSTYAGLWCRWRRG